MRSTTVLRGTPCIAPPAGEPPLHRLELPDPDAAPFAAGSFEEMGPLSWTDHPHRHTFYEIIHLTAGSGAHVIDFARWPVRPPHLAVILPGQIHHWQGDRDVDGTLALFTEDFLVDHPGDREVLRQLARAGWFTLDAEDDTRIGRLMADLAAEHRQRAAGHETVSRALLHVLVVRAARLPEHSGGTGPTQITGPVEAAGTSQITGPAGAAGTSQVTGPAGAAGPVRSPARSGALAEAFTRLTTRREAVAWSVRECADRLGVSPGHLTQAVRAATGRSPGQLLIAARVYRAQQLLAHTELPVRQVAARLGFADPAYFCRFFRRETGSSPGDFRKHHRRHHQSIATAQTHA
ncbi:AraC family transcriptional regulator [Streptomyces olivaceiscleroticus]|uniref:AraC family transcriptional regulator n=1 Tax=Streptomyces olivaceiscleroticus TaxID=68245 RepID=A0ABP3JTF5_9ACTN